MAWHFQLGLQCQSHQLCGTNTGKLYTNKTDKKEMLFYFYPVPTTKLTAPIFEYKKKFFGMRPWSTIFFIY